MPNKPAFGPGQETWENASPAVKHRRTDICRQEFPSIADKASDNQPTPSCLKGARELLARAELQLRADIASMSSACANWTAAYRNAATQSAALLAATEVQRCTAQLSDLRSKLAEVQKLQLQF